MQTAWHELLSGRRRHPDTGLTPCKPERRGTSRRSPRRRELTRGQLATPEHDARPQSPMFTCRCWAQVWISGEACPWRMQACSKQKHASGTLARDSSGIAELVLVDQGCCAWQGYDAVNYSTLEEIFLRRTASANDNLGAARGIPS